MLKTVLPLALVLPLMAIGIASAQTPVSVATTFQVDIAAANLQPRADAPPMTVANGCASQPLTHDAAIWYALLTTQPRPVGYVPSPTDPAYFERADQPGSLFIPALDVSDAVIPIRTAQHTYTATAHAANGVLKVSIGPMTLSELADLLDILKSDASFAGALRQLRATWTLFKVTGAMVGQTAAPTGSALQRAFEGDISPVDQPEEFNRRLRNPHRSNYTSVEVETGQLDITGIDSSTFTIAQSNIRSLSFLNGRRAGVAAPPGGTPPIFIIDEPCLQFSVSPVGSGDKTALKNAVSFRSRYDFLSPDGHNFTKLRAEGNAAESGNYYDHVGGSLDLGVNRRTAGGNVVAVSISGTYNFAQDNAGVRHDEWRFVAKGQFQGPNLSTLFGTLPGAGMVPLISVEAGRAGGTGAAATQDAFIGRATVTAIGRVTRRTSLDFRAIGGIARDKRYAGDDRFGYASATFRLNLTSDWDYLIKWECGQREPDYVDYCGTQSGLAVALGR